MIKFLNISCFQLETEKYKIVDCKNLFLGNERNLTNSNAISEL